jgi:hypothetical protein
MKDDLEEKGEATHVVRHKNGDQLDCRKDNLEVISKSQILRDQKQGHELTNIQERNGKFIPYAKKDGRLEYLGSFDNFETAKLVRDFYEKKVHYRIE